MSVKVTHGRIVLRREQQFLVCRQFLWLRRRARFLPLLAPALSKASTVLNLESYLDLLLFPPVAQSREGRAPIGGTRPGLRSRPGRYQQGQTAHTCLPRHQSERQRSPRSSIPTGPAGPRRGCSISNAILLYLGEKTGRFIGSPADRPEILSWLFFIANGVGSFSGQAVHFQHPAPEKIPYAVNRYRREIERHYRVLDRHLTGRDFVVGGDYSIADMSAWGWLTRASRVLPGEDDPLAAFPNCKRLSRRSTRGPRRRGRKRSRGIILSSESWTSRRSGRCSRQTIRRSRCENCRHRGRCAVAITSAIAVIPRSAFLQSAWGAEPLCRRGQPQRPMTKARRARLARRA